VFSDWPVELEFSKTRFSDIRCICRFNTFFPVLTMPQARSQKPGPGKNSVGGKDLPPPSKKSSGRKKAPSKEFIDSEDEPDSEDLLDDRLCSCSFYDRLLGPKISSKRKRDRTPESIEDIGPDSDKEASVSAESDRSRSSQSESDTPRAARRSRKVSSPSKKRRRGRDSSRRSRHSRRSRRSRRSVSRSGSPPSCKVTTAARKRGLSFSWYPFLIY
jgi:hypothetical protein